MAATASENQMTVAIPVNYCVVVLLVTNVAFSAGTTFRLFFIDRSVKNEAKEQAKQLQALYN